MDEQEELDFLDVISILSFIIGLQNLELNQKQVDGLMSEMTDHQNSMLSTIIKQNELLIQQNDEIIKLLKENRDAQNSDTKNI